MPGFGDPDPWLMVVGLAPAAHGANRTGRVFTGDRSGDVLFAALHRAGLASQPDVGAPRRRPAPDRLPGGGRRALRPARQPADAGRARPLPAPTCAASWPCCPGADVLLALGAVGWDAAPARARRPAALAALRPRRAAPPSAAAALVGSYHPSQQNIFTGRLTPAMLDEVLARARELAGRVSPADT